MSIAGHRD